MPADSRSSSVSRCIQTRNPRSTHCRAVFPTGLTRSPRSSGGACPAEPTISMFGTGATGSKVRALSENLSLPPACANKCSVGLQPPETSSASQARFRLGFPPARDVASLLGIDAYRAIRPQLTVHARGGRGPDHQAVLLIRFLHELSIPPMRREGCDDSLSRCHQDNLA
jgi:hypothetical protein